MTIANFFYLLHILLIIVQISIPLLLITMIIWFALMIHEKIKGKKVVHCKDCVHKTLTPDGEYNPDDIVCGYHMSDGFCEDDFCSYGEKKR